ncbi:hypothetical protein GCM10023219_11100 [Stakelama sediminis]
MYERDTMRFSILTAGVLLAAATATPAMAQDTAPPSPITVSGSVTLVSDYRFRGFTQNGENPAIQGGITVTHESGLYVGTWGSSINFAGNTEVDLFAGYSHDLGGGLSIDGGLLYYLYPKKGRYATDFFEPYVNLSGTYGPVTGKVGVNFAWKQDALGNQSDFSRPAGAKSSSTYMHGEVDVAIPNTPITLSGHAGHAWSDSFPGGYSGEVWDYSIGASATYKMLTFGVSYVNTDEPNVAYNDAYRGSGSNWKEDLGADGAVVFSLGASF